MPGDMRTPTRSADQIDRDALKTSAQIQQLGEPSPAALPERDLDKILVARRAATDGALQLDLLGDGQALVVTRELLLPPSHGRDDAHAELTRRTFRRISPVVDDTTDEPDPCAVLHDQVWRYSYDDGTLDEARSEVERALTDFGPDATRHGMNVLHIVVKSADGPARTSVTIDPFTEEEAALTRADDAIVVAVIDTGIGEAERLDGWLNEVERDLAARTNIDELDVFPHPTKLDFGAGHGTFAAGIIRQVEPQAKIVVYRALDSDGLGTEYDVACAMIRAANDKVHVISLSVGMEAVGGVVPPALQTAVDHIQSLADPPAIVASAGNNGNEEKVYPAAFPGVVSVAALLGVKPASSGQEPAGAEWSTHGSWVTCSAVGEGIISTFVKGDEDVFADADGDLAEEPDYSDCDSYPQDAWAVWSGTSFAAPQIAALIAKTCREDRVTPQAAVGALFAGLTMPTDGYGHRKVSLEGTPRTT